MDCKETTPLLLHASQTDRGSCQRESCILVTGDGANSLRLNGHGNARRNDGDDEERQKGDGAQGPQYEGRPDIKAQLKYIMPALALGVFLVAADQTIVVSCSGMIGSDLQALDRTSWVATAYFLTLTAFQPLYGKLSDIFGRKPTLLVAYAIFGVGCLLCGLARDMNELITARAIAGIGGGGMSTVVVVMMSDIVPLRERGTWQGIMNIIYAAGSGCGAPLGGALADYLSWRWAFLAQAPLCALAIASVAVILKLPKKEGSNWKAKLRRIDFPGAIVLVAAVFTLLLGLDRGSSFAWSDKITIGSLGVSFPLFLLFAMVESKAAEPFAPSRIIFDRGLFPCYLCNFFAYGGWFSANFYLPLFFLAVGRASATEAGVRLLPAIIAGVIGSLLGGIVMQKTGSYYWLTVTSYSCLTIGMIPIALLTGTLVMSGGLFIAGFGNGVGGTTTLIALVANASPDDQAIATGCSYLFRSLGSVVGLSLSSTVVQQSLRGQLQSHLEGRSAGEIEKRVRENLAYIKLLEPEVAEVVRQCYASATQNGFALMLGIVALAVVSSCFIKEKSLSR